MELEKIIEAVTEAKAKAKKRKFEESIEVIVNLKGIDLKRGRQLNIDAALPHALESSTRVCVIGSATLAYNARQAGAYKVLEEQDVERLGQEKEEAKALAEEVAFFIAQTDMMPLVGRILGPILGPRGKMPRPVPPGADIATLLSEFSSSVKLRMRKNLVIQAKVGKQSMDPKLVAENIQAVIVALERNLEKGMDNIRNIFVKTTMGPAIEIKM
ncbi:MAG: 50S ribosomal protein L1 [Promethearchaeota archaeon]